MNVAHEDGVTALMYAAAGGHVDAMKMLMDKGKADLHAKTFRRQYCLYGGIIREVSWMPCSFSLTEVQRLTLLISTGVTPLMAVASLGNFEAQALIIETLKKKMSDQELKDHINMFSESGGSSVMFAASGGHAACTKQLIEHGADVNAVARATPEYLVKVEKQMEDGTYPEPDPHVDGVTALHVAAQSGRLEVCPVAD